MLHFIRIFIIVAILHTLNVILGFASPFGTIGWLVDVIGITLVALGITEYVWPHLKRHFKIKA